MISGRPRTGELYRHFKGNLYQIVTVAKHSETGEELVVYQALYGDYAVYARPLSMFVSEVDREKYPDVKQQLRFERVEKAVEEKQEKSLQLKTVQEEPVQEEQVQEEQASPELLRFLDAETYTEKYKVLQGMENTITDRLINDFAVILDVVIPEGELSDRYNELKQCIATMARYESTRLR